MIIIDIKIYKDGRERQTVRGLSYAQAGPLSEALKENGIKYKSIVWESIIPMKEGEGNEKEVQFRRVI